MSHIIHFTAADDAPTAEVAAELERLLESCTRAVAQHFTQPDLSRSALLLKRSRVQLPDFEGRWFATGRDQERLGELINVLATVARTVDALHYLAAEVGGSVAKCNPSTSDDGHDIEVVAGQRQVLVEVSDVAGGGNANGKMTKDLATLLSSDESAERLLAVSEKSGQWLTRANGGNAARRGANCRLVAQVPSDREMQTWVVAVDPLTP